MANFVLSVGTNGHAKAYIAGLAARCLTAREHQVLTPCWAGDLEWVHDAPSGVILHPAAATDALYQTGRDVISLTRSELLAAASLIGGPDRTWLESLPEGRRFWTSMKWGSLLRALLGWQNGPFAPENLDPVKRFYWGGEPLPRWVLDLCNRYDIALVFMTREWAAAVEADARNLGLLAD